jgi:uncharacterized protein
MNDFLPASDSNTAAAPGPPAAFSFSSGTYLPPSADDAATRLVPLPRLIPHIGHTVLFFLVAFATLILGQFGAAVVVRLATHGAHPHRGLRAALDITATDPRFSIPTQAAIYGLLVLVSIPIFSALWLEPFGEGVHWNAAAARRRFLLLIPLGLVVGISIGAIGNWLPMPKSPPILDDMMKSSVGAWMMLCFGVTAAPMVEELAFRGFLLPSLLNVFRWLERRGFSTPQVTRWIGIPVSIVLTTIPFTLLHAQQVSDSWGPLLLIGLVSVVLCIVRLALNSVAAGAVVHAAYNFTLFAGVLYQTGGFQHLDKLSS